MNPLIQWGIMQNCVPTPWLSPSVLSWGDAPTEARHILSYRTLLFTEAKPWIFKFPCNFLPISYKESRTKASSSYCLTTRFVSGACDWESKKSGPVFLAASSDLNFAAPYIPG